MSTTNPGRVPANAREALDLAWHLAHPVKAGDVLPTKTEYLVKYPEESTPIKYRASAPIEIRNHYQTTTVRTLDPLPEPEPEPDWLNAPAVLAGCPDCDTDKLEFWIPNDADTWTCIGACFTTRKWWELKDVTPLYPKEDTLNDAPRYRTFSFRDDKQWGSELGGEPV